MHYCKWSLKWVSSVMKVVLMCNKVCLLSMQKNKKDGDWHRITYIVKRKKIIQKVKLVQMQENWHKRNTVFLLNFVCVTVWCIKRNLVSSNNTVVGWLSNLCHRLIWMVMALKNTKVSSVFLAVALMWSKKWWIFLIEGFWL